MKNKVLMKAIKKAIKILEKEGYEISSKSISEDGPTISMKVIAETKSDEVVTHFLSL